MSHIPDPSDSTDATDPTEDDNPIDPGKQARFLELVGIIADKKAAFVAKEKLERAAAREENKANKKKRRGKDAAAKAQNYAAYKAAEAAHDVALKDMLLARREWDDAALEREAIERPIPDFSTMDQAEIEAELKATYPDNDFGPSPLGDGKVCINGKIDIDPGTLRRMSPYFRGMMLDALAADPMSKEQERAILKVGGSGGMRFRFREDAARGESFLTDLDLNPDQITQIEKLYSPDDGPEASIQDKYRAYDIVNKFARSGANDDQKALCVRAVDFALRLGVTSLPELVDTFDFYQKTYETELAAEAERIALTEGKSEKEAKEQARANIDARHRDADAMPDAVFEEIRDDFDGYKNAVTSTAVGLGPIDCAQDTSDFAANNTALSALGANLKFGALSTAAYHTFKHYDELHASEKQTFDGRNDYENKVLSYHNGARAAVSAGRDPSWKVSQNGGESHFFTGPSCKAIVWLNGGKAGLATYF